jgi:hypothetical protein
MTRLMTEEDENIVLHWSDHQARIAVLRKYFPFEVLVSESKSGLAFKYCKENFGRRFDWTLDDHSHIGVWFNNSARWDWNGSALFRTSEDAVMFKLGFPGK